MSMNFPHHVFNDADPVDVASAEMWTRRNRAAMASVSLWIEDLGLPATRKGRMEDYWVAQSNWPGDRIQVDDDGNPVRKIPADQSGLVFIEAGEIRAQVMERDRIAPLELIALAKGYMRDGAADYDLAWKWLCGRVDFAGWHQPLELVMPQPPKFLPVSHLVGMEVPSRRWLVECLIPDQTVTLLTGDGGTGKSLLALQLAAAVASGTGWLGRQADVGSVIFLSAEDDMDELHRRIADVAMNAGVGLDELYDLHIRSTVGNGALLADKTRNGFAPSALFKEIEGAARDEMARLVVLDTLANFYPGDENDRAQTTQFVDILKGLAVRCNCAVLLLAHPSKSSMETGAGYSGNTAWNNAVRSRLYLQRVTQDGYEPDPDARVLRTMKANYGRVGGELALTYRAGSFEAMQPETGLDRVANSAKAERVFLSLLRLFTDQGRRVNSAGGTNHATKVFADHPQNEGVTKRAFKSAMEALLSRKVIEICEEGPASRRVSYLREVAK